MLLRCLVSIIITLFWFNYPCKTNCPMGCTVSPFQDLYIAIAPRESNLWQLSLTIVLCCRKVPKHWKIREHSTNWTSMDTFSGSFFAASASLGRICRFFFIGEGQYVLVNSKEPSRGDQRGMESQTTGRATDSKTSQGESAPLAVAFIFYQQYWECYKKQMNGFE